MEEREIFDQKVMMKKRIYLPANKREKNAKKEKEKKEKKGEKRENFRAAGASVRGQIFSAFVGVDLN